MTLTSQDLLVWGRQSPDPWNRLCPPSTPLLLLVEFCQVEGPRPLLALQSGGGTTTLDVDALSLWLMSSDSPGGTITVLFHQQMGLYSMAYHCAVYDVDARAFQRPICISYLQTERPSPASVSLFSSRVRRLSSPLLSCNRRLFLALLSRLLLLSDDINSDLVHEYYALCRPELIDDDRVRKNIATVAEQARRLQPRLQMMTDSLSRRLHCECSGHSDAPLPEWLFQGGSKPLQPLSALAPCAYPSLVASLHDLLLVLGRRECPVGVLYSGDSPVLRLAKCSTPLKESGKRERKAGEKEESLRTCTLHLDQVLYPVVAGDDLAVCGSALRKDTVVDLVTKLEFARPKAHVRNKESVWGKDGAGGVFGVLASRNSPPPFPRLLDLNSCVLRGVAYKGNLLARLRPRRSFPSDDSVLSFVASTLTMVSQTVYLGRYLPLRRVVEGEKLSSDDERVVCSLLTEVDFSKFSSLRGFSSLPPPTPARAIHL